MTGKLKYAGIRHDVSRMFLLWLLSVVSDSSFVAPFSMLEGFNGDYNLQISYMTGWDSFPSQKGLMQFD